MFEALGQRFTSIFSGLRGKVSQARLDQFSEEIKTALIESDGALEVANRFSAQLAEKFNQNSDEINKSINPAQKIYELVNSQLVQTLGGATRRLKFAKNPPTVILLTGLQGAGKTTLAGKLAKYLKNDGNTPILVEADMKRQHEVNQLKVDGESAGHPVFDLRGGKGGGGARVWERNKGRRGGCCGSYGGIGRSKTRCIGCVT